MWKWQCTSNPNLVTETTILMSHKLSKSDHWNDHLGASEIIWLHFSHPSSWSAYLQEKSTPCIFIWQTRWTSLIKLEMVSVFDYVWLCASFSILWSKWTISDGHKTWITRKHEDIYIYLFLYFRGWSYKAIWQFIININIIHNLPSIFIMYDIYILYINIYKCLVRRNLYPGFNTWSDHINGS